MRHALLRRHRRLGETQPEIAREEQRIVAEATAAARLLQNFAIHPARYDSQRPSMAGDRNDAFGDAISSFLERNARAVND